MQWLALEIIVSPIKLENLLLRIGQDRHRKLDAVLVVLEDLRGFKIISPDRNCLDVQLLESLEFLSEDLKLLHAMGTFSPEEKQE